jgi:alpha-L-rhamnosidase
MAGSFGKSLCHAWGASPIYLLGKYYLGIKPTTRLLMQRILIEPQLGGLQWIDGKVPTPDGDVSVYCSANQRSK